MSSTSKREQEKNVQFSLTDIISSKDDGIHILNSLLQSNAINMDQINEAAQKLNNGEIHDDENNKQKSQKKMKKKKEKKHKKQKTIYMTRHVAFRFHYDGAKYNGLAQNRNSATDNSVEKALFAALEKTCLIEPDLDGDGSVVESCGCGESQIQKNNAPDVSDGSNNNYSNRRSDCKYSRSGRTDKGVSAFGQVIALRVRSAFPAGAMIASDIDMNQSMKVMQETDLPNNSINEVTIWIPCSTSSQQDVKEDKSLQQRTITEKNFCQMLNNVLPTDIRMLGWSPVSDEFSARFSTSSRTYRYFFIQRDLNLRNMQQALDFMVGRHDFRNLCKMNCEEVDNFVRVIHYGKIVQTNNNTENNDMSSNDEACHSSTGDKHNDYRRPCYFEIQGQAFLWHQIRCIASILFMVGKSLESPNVVKELLDIETNPAKPSYPFAQDLPLVLHKCDYNNLTFGHSVQNLWRVSCDLEKKWEELTLAAERLKNGMDSLGKDSMVATADLSSYIRGLAAEWEKKTERNDDLSKEKNNKFNVEGLSTLARDQSHITWKEALGFIYKHGGGKPEAEGQKIQLHIPLMDRAKGTTYEEKIKAILATDGDGVDNPPSKRRREIYETNIKKKKVNLEEDASFYNKMLGEGGSGL